MEPHEKPEFARSLLGVGEVYGQKFSPQRQALYWEVLKSYPLADVVEGIARHLADPDVGQFLPKPADIVRQIAGSTDTQAMQAWTKVAAAVARVGSYQTVVFDDWRIHAVIRDMGGWVRMCEMRAEDDPREGGAKADMPFIAREFEKRYRGMKGERAYPAKLIGRSEAENVSRGFEKFVEPPRLIGDQRLAQLTYKRGDNEQARLQIGTLGAKPVAELVQLTAPAKPSDAV